MAYLKATADPQTWKLGKQDLLHYELKQEVQAMQVNSISASPHATYVAGAKTTEIRLETTHPVVLGDTLNVTLDGFTGTFVVTEVEVDQLHHTTHVIAQLIDTLVPKFKAMVKGSQQFLVLDAKQRPVESNKGGKYAIFRIGAVLVTIELLGSTDKVDMWSDDCQVTAQLRITMQGPNKPGITLKYDATGMPHHDVHISGVIVENPASKMYIGFVDSKGNEAASVPFTYSASQFDFLKDLFYGDYHDDVYYKPAKKWRFHNDKGSVFNFQSLKLARAAAAKGTVIEHLTEDDEVKLTEEV